MQSRKIRKKPPGTSNNDETQKRKWGNPYEDTVIRQAKGIAKGEGEEAMGRTGAEKVVITARREKLANIDNARNEEMKRRRNKGRNKSDPPKRRKRRETTHKIPTRSRKIRRRTEEEERTDEERSPEESDDPGELEKLLGEWKGNTPKKFNRKNKDIKQTQEIGKKTKMKMETNKHNRNIEMQPNKESGRSKQTSHGEAMRKPKKPKKPTRRNQKNNMKTMSRARWNDN